MASETPILGWIGLGSMGIGMASNLQKHLVQKSSTGLVYYNRSIERGAPLKKLGGRPASSIAQLVTECDIIFMSLSDDSALNAVIDTVLSIPDDQLAGKSIIDTTTVHPDTTQAVEARLKAKGVKFVAAPVFGASPVAAQGQLLWILAGDSQGIESIKPFIVGVMGRAIIELGDQANKSTMLKTAGNFVTAGMMEVIAEAHVFAEKAGLGTEAMESLIEHQYGPLALSMSKRMTTGAYMPAQDTRPMSDLKLALKDVGHGVDCAKSSGSRLWVGELALKNLNDADEFSQKRSRPLDSSSMYGVLRQQAGLPFENDVINQRDEAGL